MLEKAQYKKTVHICIYDFFHQETPHDVATERDDKDIVDYLQGCKYMQVYNWK